MLAEDKRFFLQRWLEDYFGPIVQVEIYVGIMVIIAAFMARIETRNHSNDFWQRLDQRLPTVERTITPIPVSTAPPDEMPIQLN